VQPLVAGPLLPGAQLSPPPGTTDSYSNGLCHEHCSGASGKRQRFTMFFKPSVIDCSFSVSGTILGLDKRCICEEVSVSKVGVDGLKVSKKSFLFLFQIKVLQTHCKKPNSFICIPLDKTACRPFQKCSRLNHFNEVLAILQCCRKQNISC
jgi:hypothetical protein